VERWVTYHLIEPLWEEMLEEHPRRDRRRSPRAPRPGRQIAVSALSRRVRRQHPPAGHARASASGRRGC
jgi:hypothetical protein